MKEFEQVKGFKNKTSQKSILELITDAKKLAGEVKGDSPNDLYGKLEASADRALRALNELQELTKRLK